MSVLPLLCTDQAHAETVSYTYDDLGRLKTVTYGNGQIITYTYDAAGNRTQLVQAAPTTPSPTGSLSASPNPIIQGNATTLTWSSTNATGASIDNGVGAITPVSGGTVSVSPTSTTTYTLSLSGPGGTAAPQTTVTVNPPGPSGSLTASPPTIVVGGSTTLTWASTNATSASIDNGVGAVTPASGGSVSVSPTSNTTYTLTLTGPGGSVTRQAAVTVNPAGFNQTIAVTGTGPVNLRSLANAAGYDGAQQANVTFTVASGVTISGAAGAPNGGIAIDTGTWPTGTFSITIALQVSGKVYGGGGAGGEGSAGGAASVGSTGGDAIYCRLPMSIVVNAGGQIKSGGGGGGGGGAWTRSVLVDNEPVTLVWNGGGGGGGFPNGVGGPEGQGVDNDISAPGANGTSSGGGAGGAGGTIQAGRTTGAGGAGGAGGASGSNGANATGSGGSGWFGTNITGAAGGAAGFAVRKNTHTVSVTNNGTISGTQG